MKTINLKQAMALNEERKNAKDNLAVIMRLFPTDPYRIGIARKAAETSLDECVKYLDETLTPAIKEAEGRATERTIDAAVIIRTLNEVTDTLGISKKAMEGVWVDCNPHAQTFPRAYKYTPMSTQFSAVYKAGSWRLTNIRRDACRNNRIVIFHTQTSREALIDRLSIIK